MAPFEQVKSAPIEATADGDNTVVAAVATKRIRVLAWTLVASAAGGVRWKSGAAVNLSGAMPFAVGGGASAAVGPGGGFLFQTAVGDALVLNCGAGVDALGVVTYQEVA